MDILPCPFCGCEGVLVDRPNHNMYFVGCGNEECDMSIEYVFQGSDEEEVITKWNTRVTEDENPFAGSKRGIPLWRG